MPYTQKKVISSIEEMIRVSAQVMYGGRQVNITSFLEAEKVVLELMLRQYPNADITKNVQFYSAEINKRLPANFQVTPEELVARLYVLTQYSRFLSETPPIYHAPGTGHPNSISPIPVDSGLIIEWAEVAKIELTPQQYAQNLFETVLFKLAGGLGTSQGMENSKGFLEVVKGLTVFDILKMQINVSNELVRQSGYSGIAVGTLVSPFTDQDVAAALDGDLTRNGVSVTHMMQDLVPRVDPESKRACLAELGDGGAPAGHGEIFSIFQRNLPKLKQWLAEGRKYINLSNIDNFHGTVDPRIVELMKQQSIKVLVEVLDPIQSDVKGGKFCMVGGKLTLVEVASASKKKPATADSTEEPGLTDTHFSDKVEVDPAYPFNSNDIWYDLEQLIREIETNGVPDLPLIVNKKPYVGPDGVTREGIQLETAMGTNLPDGVRLLKVGRDRFFPIKTNADLLKLMALHELNEKGEFEFSHTRKTAIERQEVRDYTPVVVLSDKPYKKIADFNRRVTVAPNLDRADYFKVDGDVHFDNPELSISGGVSIDVSKAKHPVRFVGYVALSNISLELNETGELKISSRKLSRLNVLEPAPEAIPSLAVSFDEASGFYLVSQVGAQSA